MNGREISFKILKDIIYNQAYSNISLNNNIKKYKGYEEEGFIREIVYGVLENLSYIDHIIFKVSSIKKKKVHKDILTILRLGTYQIIFMDRVPDSAAVNESVELAKNYGNRGSIGYVNGVLRNISRNKEALKIIEERDPIKKLSIEYSHPSELVEYFVEEFGLDFTRELLIKNNQVPDFNIRVNTLKTSREELGENLSSLGYRVRYGSYGEESLKIENPENIFNTEEYKKGMFSIQDESSNILIDIIDPEKGSLVLDTCAAPGGKSTGLAEKMDNKGLIYSRDIHKHRVRLIKENAERLGITIINESIMDSKILDQDLVGKVDYCLVDAPCSGLGTIRRNPEIKYTKTRQDMENLSNIQFEILNVAKNYIREDGELYYSTCTIGRVENDRVIDRFLRENPDFKIGKISFKSLEDSRGFVKLYPNIHGSDGFFMCKLVKA